jgi:hypothetical protein
MIRFIFNAAHGSMTYILSQIYRVSVVYSRVLVVMCIKYLNSDTKIQTVGFYTLNFVLVVVGF